ncbi:MAG: chromosome segregation protein SMC [Elusimicrobia bacterium RIFOXYB2_FULL_49_7]|nr:MAG: chromosome segregation protein SMC [Elusimicrobia bacterium RIFOXYB2_FULL_49_7]
MHLKQLKISGFKSFADVHSVTFNEGLTAIVGPNGCGKSNIIDAIRWVLGEQRVKTLRCEKMEDVVFSGTIRRKPLNFAEVTLSIENEDRALPTDSATVQITRRIFRTGESEYLINKKLCRLKDITSLFFDTGMGIGSYSLMEQKMIDTLLSEKDEERRIMFEEAAGINKYRSQRKEALKNLLKTGDDLARIADLVNEKDRTVKMLARHVVKAEKYREYRTELVQLDVAVCSRVFGEVNEKIREVSRDHAGALTEKEKLAAEIATAESGIEQQELLALEREEKLQAISRELSDLTRRQHDLESQLLSRGEKIEGAHRAIATTEQYQGKLNENIAQLGNEQGDAEEQLIRLSTLVKEAEGDYLAARREFDEFEIGVAEKRLNLNENQQAKIRFMEEETDLKSRLEKIKSDIGNLRSNRTEIERVMAEGRYRTEQCEEQIRLCRESLSQVSAESLNLSGSRDQLVERIASEENRFRTLLEQEKTLEAHLISDEKKLEFFEQMKKNHEGYKEAVRAVVESGISGISGIVADAIDVAPEFVAGIEAALGSRVQYILADTEAAAQAAIRFLREGKMGKASFVVQNQVRGRHRSPEIDNLGRLDGVIGWADRFVKLRGDQGELASLLLGDVLLIRDASMVERIREQCGDFAVYCITPDGDLHTTHGIVRGGEFGNQELGLLSRTQVLETLHENVGKYRVQIEEKIRDKKTALLTVEEAKTALLEIDEKLNSGRRLQQEQEGNIRHLDEEVLRVQSRENEALERLKGLDQRLEEWAAAEGRIMADLQILEEKKTEVESFILLLNQEVTALEEQRFKVTETVKNAEVRLAGVKQEAINLKRNAERLAEEIARAYASLDQGREAKNRYEVEIEDYRRHMDELAQEKERCQNSIKTVEAEEKARREELAVLRNEISNVRKVSKEQEKVLAVHTEKLHECEMSLERLNEKKRSMVERIWEEYEKDLNGLIDEDKALAVTEEEARDKIEILRKRLKTIGPNVNLSVLEDYEGEKKSFDELSLQKADLESAKHTLEQLIRKLDKEACEKFLSTFNQVRENFRSVFLDLFEGGEADIRLEEHEDPLQAKIAIYARPSGKSMKSINLLSGGERALTATSLLFGLYLVKPSPYCILDEVDGPLDDANIGRFIRLIRRFSERTQFLVISHNKKTMAACDILYGVTLAEPGVSRLVSVSLATESDEKKIDELMALRA